ncbi:UNVERIFIED_CONTAM: hypothetical protein Sindi_1708600 [Sesamum indicum]
MVLKLAEQNPLPSWRGVSYQEVKDQSTLADFAGKEEMVEFRQQVTKDTMPTECGIPFNEHIMGEELPSHFQAPSYLPIYDGTTDPAEHIHNLKMQPCCTVRSFVEFSSLFQHQFSSSKKYRKLAISLFEIKQDEKETLRTYVQCFNTTIQEVPTAHQEMLVNAFTQGLHGGPLFESLAKKSTTNFF